MNCPHCGKVVKLVKDSNVGQSETATSDELGALLEAIDEDSLEGASIEFVKQIRERYEQYGSRTRMSDKQMKWLRELAEGEMKW